MEFEKIQVVFCARLHSKGCPMTNGGYYDDHSYLGRQTKDIYKKKLPNRTTERATIYWLLQFDDQTNLRFIRSKSLESVIDATSLEKDSIRPKKIVHFHHSRTSNAFVSLGRQLLRTFFVSPNKINSKKHSFSILRSIRPFCSATRQLFHSIFIVLVV